MRCRCSDIRRADQDLNTHIPNGLRFMGNAQTNAGEMEGRLGTVSGHVSTGVYAKNMGDIVAEIMEIVIPVHQAIEAVQERFNMARESVEIKRGMFRTEDVRFHAAQEAARLANLDLGAMREVAKQATPRPKF